MTIELAGVTVRRGGRTILGPLDWTVRPGERWAVLGPNGSGKTTLLQVVSLYLWPTAGTVDVLGGRFGRMDAREQRRRIGYAGSALEAEMDEALSPSQLVISARHAALAPWWHVYDDADRIRAAALIERFGISHVADHPFRTLSSGERRRVSIARALMPDPDLLLLDEPGAGLDLGARETLIRDLTALAGEPRPSPSCWCRTTSRRSCLASGSCACPPRWSAGPLCRADRRGRERGRSRGGPNGMPIAVERHDGRLPWARRADEEGRGMHPARIFGRMLKGGAFDEASAARGPVRRHLTRDRHREAAGYHA